MSNIRNILENPFVNMNNAEEATRRLSLEPPTITDMIASYSRCIQRASHTQLAPFRDPTFRSCGENAAARFRAYLHWGKMTAGDTSLPPADFDYFSGVGPGAPRATQLLTQTVSASSSSSSSSANAPSNDPMDFSNNSTSFSSSSSAASAQSSSASSQQKAGKPLIPKGVAADTIQKVHNATYSEKRSLNPYRKFTLAHCNGKYDEDVRFVLRERRSTVDLSLLPWAPRENYIKLLRKEGRLPEQVEEAMTEIKKRCNNISK